MPGFENEDFAGGRFSFADDAPPSGRRQRKLLQGKIHRARVTEAELEYEGSVTIDQDLLDAAGLLVGEAVWVWNVTNGERFETYTISGERGKGQICINGAAAHRAGVDDLVIIAAFTWMAHDDALEHQPKAVFVDENNRIREVRTESSQAVRSLR